MSDSALIDKIVNGVLLQLAGGSGAPAALPVTKPAAIASTSTVVSHPAKLVTADSLAAVADHAQTIEVPAKAIITPAAQDFAKERGLQLVRMGSSSPISASFTAKTESVKETASGKLLIVVHHTDVVGRLWEELKGNWKREMLGCPDDAAKLAISELSRGGVGQVVILAQQALRAACLANRNEKVKAVPIQSVLDIKSARKQLRVNVWCLDPADKSWFELRNLLKSIES